MLLLKRKCIPILAFGHTKDRKGCSIWCWSCVCVPVAKEWGWVGWGSISGKNILLGSLTNPLYNFLACKLFLRLDCSCKYSFNTCLSTLSPSPPPPPHPTHTHTPETGPNGRSLSLTYNVPGFLKQTLFSWISRVCTPLWYGDLLCRSWLALRNDIRLNLNLVNTYISEMHIHEQSDKFETKLSTSEGAISKDYEACSNRKCFWTSNNRGNFSTTKCDEITSFC